MQKRRQRIEQWRLERKCKESGVSVDKNNETEASLEEKKWSLENDSDDEELPQEVEETPKEDEEIDSLDAFMNNLNKDVRNDNVVKKESGGVVIMSGVAKKTTNSVKRGELMEQNQDALEYSSEEEYEDLKETAEAIVNKQKKDLVKINHNNVNYAEFRKNFYVEVNCFF